MATLPEGFCESRDVLLLAHSDRAEEAFQRLWNMMSGRLAKAAIRTGLSPEDAEDATLSVAAALWERRESLANMTVGGFWAFAFRAVKNQAFDRLRRQAKVAFIHLNEEQDVPDDEMTYIDAAVAEFLNEGSLYGSADRLWLGDEENFATQSLALQLCLRQGLSWKEAAEIVGLPHQHVVSPVAARHALFATLVWNHESLAAHVLRPDEPIESFLDRFHRGKPVTSNGWTEMETTIVLLHICHAMNATEIVRHLGKESGIDGSIDSIIDRAVRHYPFVDLVVAALQLLRSYVEDVLRHTGLWKRIVFEYATRMQLPHKQIIERAGPAASEVEVKISETTLNSWIGNGRLWAQLAAFMHEENAYAAQC